MGVLSRRIAGFIVFWIVSGPAIGAAEESVVVPCRVTAVPKPCQVDVAWPGSTHIVRLAAVECPADGTEWGTRTVRATRLMVGDDRSVVLRVERSRPDRPLVGHLQLSDGEDLGRELVSRGLAWAERGRVPPLPELLTAEATARSNRRGIWGDPDGPRPGPRSSRRPSITITEPAPSTPSPSRPGTPGHRTCRPRSDCCKICSKGKACGNSCINASYTCHKGWGCACNVYEVC